MAPPHKYPLFVYLIKARDCEKEKSKIGVASDPFRRVEQHCKRSRWWKWDIQLVIGPFYSGANLFKHQWQGQSRKYRCRVVRGVQKALTYRSASINIYAKEPSAIIQVFRNHKKKKN
jgi:hypothetical protein